MAKVISGDIIYDGRMVNAVGTAIKGQSHMGNPYEQFEASCWYCLDAQDRIPAGSTTAAGFTVQGDILSFTSLVGR